MTEKPLSINYGEFFAALISGSHELRIGYEREGCRVALSGPHGSFPVQYLMNEDGTVWHGTPEDARYAARGVLDIIDNERR